MWQGNLPALAVANWALDWKQIAYSQPRGALFENVARSSVPFPQFNLLLLPLLSLCLPSILTPIPSQRSMPLTHPTESISRNNWLKSSTPTTYYTSCSTSNPGRLPQQWISFVLAFGVASSRIVTSPSRSFSSVSAWLVRAIGARMSDILTRLADRLA